MVHWWAAANYCGLRGMALPSLSVAYAMEANKAALGLIVGDTIYLDNIPDVSVSGYQAIYRIGSGVSAGTYPGNPVRCYLRR